MCVKQLFAVCTQEVAPYFVIIVPSYNNEQWYKKNLDSIFSQTYKNFVLIYIDDASTDSTGLLVQEYLQKKQHAHQIIFLQNKINTGALENLYNTIHACPDNAIIVTVDGDDWLAHERVLEILAVVYMDEAVWMTYGQYVQWPSGKIGGCRAIDQEMILNNTYRSIACSASHLRTFYAWLFKKIKKEDLQKDGKFFSVAWDWAILYPLLEMAGEHAQFIPEVLYQYNMKNLLSDHRKKTLLQIQTAKYIQKLPKYTRL